MVLGFIADVINAILSVIVNIILLIVEIIVVPIRALGYLISGRRAGGSGYFSRPWGWSWRNRTYMGGRRGAHGGAIV